MSLYSDLSRSRGVGKNMRYSMYWSLEKEILLIKYFEQHRYLWDTEHVLFHKREPRMKSFAELVELLQIDEGTIRQRWSSMRSQFCREERKVSMTPNYIPTWDHYNALVFLRKPTPGQRYINMYSQSSTSPPVKDEYADVLQIQPAFEDSDEGTSNDYGMAQQQMESIVQRLQEQQQRNGQHQADEEQSNEAVVNSPTSPHRQESPLGNGVPTMEDFRPDSPPAQLIRKIRTLPQKTVRRFNPGYNRKYRERCAPVALPAVTNTTIAESSGLPTENESFTNYIASVLERFPSDIQRRCRNELLRVILKYDDEDCASSSNDK